MELVFGKLIFLEAAANVMECAGLKKRQGSAMFFFSATHVP